MLCYTCLHTTCIGLVIINALGVVPGADGSGAAPAAFLAPLYLSNTSKACLTKREGVHILQQDSANKWLSNSIRRSFMRSRTPTAQGAVSQKADTQELSPETNQESYHNKYPSNQVVDVTGFKFSAGNQQATPILFPKLDSPLSSSSLRASHSPDPGSPA